MTRSKSPSDLGYIVVLGPWGAIASFPFGFAELAGFQLSLDSALVDDREKLFAHCSSLCLVLDLISINHAAAIGKGTHGIAIQNRPRRMICHLIDDLEGADSPFGAWPTSFDRNDIMPGQWWKDAINQAIQKGAFFIACFSKELNERQETYMHGELRRAIDKLRNMPKNRVWFIPVLINATEVPSPNISDHETLQDINAVKLYEDWQEGLTKILRAMKLDDPDYRRALHLVDLIRHHPAEREHAIEQLACIPGAAAFAVPALIEALRDADKETRKRSP